MKFNTLINSLLEKQKMFWQKFKKRRPVHKIVSTAKRKKINWKKVALYCAYTFVVFVFLIAGAFAWFTKDIPTPAKIAARKPPQSTKIYDRTGKILLYETGEQKRTVVESNQIANNFKEATVAIEDWNFYNHHGFSPRGVAAAVYGKITGKTSQLRGGSTLTQQYVKLGLLEDSNRTITRKVKELILAIELEFMYNKDEILTMYLNEVPYGNNTAGAEAAARMYYNKPATDLTLAQAATLAAIPKSPTYYSPYGTHVDKLITRKNLVLTRMVETGKITQAQADEAKKEDTTTIGVSLRPRHDTILAPHFAMYVLETAADKFGEEAIQKNGLTIVTTLDYDKQKMAEDSINEGSDKLAKYNASNAALVAVDPKTGQVLAMLGSKDYWNQSIDGNVNVADSLRQPGSSFKPFAYATAFKQPEYSPSKIIFDLQTDFGGGYVPQNYNGRFNGPVTIRQALANSLNIPAVKILSLAGIDNTLRTAEDLGITTLNQRDRYGLSLVLGAGEVKPVEMAGAFGVFATGGVKHDLASMLKVTGSDGQILYEYKPTDDIGRKVLDPQIAYEISSILTDNNARSLVFGTRSALAFQDRTVAAKTGTTSSFKDAWTVGYTPSISVAVWVGNSDATAMKTGADGSVLAGPIFHKFIDKALANTPNEEFAKPDGITEVEVDKFSNKLPSQYSQERTKDIFASWQVPTDQDTVHFGAKFCKGTNKLAPDGMPDSLVETRVYNVIHSERPDNPNWENPVRGWASANGYSTTDIPKEQCNLNDFTPSISIASPSDGASVSGNTQITASVNQYTNSASVEFYIDNISIGTVNSAPYKVTYNMDNLSTDSAHKITAVVTDENKVTARSEISVKVAKNNTPATISNVNTSPTSNSAMIAWTTSKDATGQIYYGTKSGSTLSDYAQNTSQIPVLTTSHTLGLTALTPGTKYYFRIVSIDAGNNQAISSEGSFTTLP